MRTGTSRYASVKSLRFEKSSLAILGDRDKVMRDADRRDSPASGSRRRVLMEMYTVAEMQITEEEVKEIYQSARFRGKVVVSAHYEQDSRHLFVSLKLYNQATGEETVERFLWPLMSY